MNQYLFSVRSAGAGLLTAAVLATSLAAQQSVPLLSIKATDEVAPPGGTAQVKVLVTEPQPITTGGSAYHADAFQTIDGLAISSPADDTYGVAIVQGTDVSVSVVSRTASFGLEPDYPALTVTGRLPDTAPLGTVFPFEIDEAAFAFRNPAGLLYPAELKDGSVTVRRTLSVDDVQPGSADLPRGAVVTIRGTGFVPRTRIRFNEVKLSSTRFVSSSQIDVVLGAPARMHGMRIRAENPDGAKTTYFSYQRHARIGSSSHRDLRNAVPLFPPGAATAVRIVPGAHSGLAIQNPQPVPVLAVTTLVASDGAVLAVRALILPRYSYLVREDLEMFGFAPPHGSVIRVQASTGVQAMGIAIGALGELTPILPTH